MQPTHSLSSLPQTHVPSAHGNTSAQTKTPDGDSSTGDGITHNKTLQTQHYQTSRTISSEAYSVDLQSQRTLTNNERDTLTHTLTYSVNYRSESQSSTSIEQTTKVNNTPALLDGARNILQFIEQRVASEQADGASIDELSELIDQGLSGFLQGFNEAKNLLGDDKALNDRVNASISLLHDQVIDGITTLRQTYLGEHAPEESTISSPPVSDQIVNTPNASTQALTNVADSPQQPATDALSPLDQLLTAMGQPNKQLITLLDTLEEIESVNEHVLAYKETQQFSFRLTTADGDEITINADRSASFSAASYSTEKENIGLQSSSDHQQFSFQINGELDGDEITAINDLLIQVMSLSEQFYGGDIGAAYQTALELNYDSSEITAYALRLTQVETYEVAATYNANRSETLPPNDLHAIFKQIGDYSQQVLESITNPEHYRHVHYAQLIEQLAQQIDQQVANTDGYSFGQSINDAKNVTQL